MLNHLLWLGCHGMDCGAMNILIYCFREREDLFDMYEAVSGARMHAAYFRPGGVYRDLPDSDAAVQGSKHPQRARRSGAERNRQGSLLDFIEDFTRALPEERRRVRDAAHRQPHLEAAHRGHRRGHARARAEPGLHRPDAARLGHRLGPAQDQPYDVYDRMDFDIPVGVNGDTYDRYLVRIEEMRQSNRIIQQCVEWLRANPGPVITDNHKVAPPRAWT
jgi:NADH-quinone oxidoreductase subunit D